MTGKTKRKAPDPAAAVRAELYHRLQWTVAGHRTEDVIAALTDSLAAAVGFAVEDQAQADRLIDSLAADAKLAMRENWTYIQQMKDAAKAPPDGYPQHD